MTGERRTTVTAADPRLRGGAGAGPGDGDRHDRRTGTGRWSATLSVPPGSHVVAAFELSEKDGGEVAVDTTRVTVSGR